MVDKVIGQAGNVSKYRKKEFRRKINDTGLSKCVRIDDRN
jgi:hypothetical protein